MLGKWWLLSLFPFCPALAKIIFLLKVYLRWSHFPAVHLRCFCTAHWCYGDTAGEAQLISEQKSQRWCWGNASCFGRCWDKTRSWQLVYTSPVPERIPNNNRSIFAALSDHSLLQTWGAKANFHTALSTSSVFTTVLLPHCWERQIKSIFAGGREGTEQNVMRTRSQPFFGHLGFHLARCLIMGKMC